MAERLERAVKGRLDSRLARSMPVFPLPGQCRARNRGCDFDQLLGLGEIGDQQLTEKHHVPSCWRQVAALLLTVLLRSEVMLKTRRDDTCWRGLDKGVNFR